eukprot:5772390-Amphidinium_carterae.1
MPSTRRLGLKHWWSASGSNGNTPRNTEKAWPLGLIQWTEEVAGNAEGQEHAFHEGEEQDQQEAGEMRVPVAPSEKERKYHNLTHYPYKEWCEHCVRGRGHEDRHHTQREADQQGTTMVQLDYSFLADGELQVPLLAAIDNVHHRTMAVLVPLKGAVEYAVKSIRIFIQSLGTPSGVIQSDSEHTALAVSKAAVEPTACRLEYTTDTTKLQRLERD